MGLFDRFRKRKPTQGQLQRLSKIRNPTQRRALLLAIEQGEEIPDYAWKPLPEDFDPTEMVRRAREAVESARVTEPPTGTDLGLEMLQYVYENMGIDEEWSVREERGFTWWGHRLAQRVWVEPPRQDGEFEIFRIHARTDFLRDVPASLETARRVAVFNKFASLNALVWEPTEGRVSVHCSAFIHAQTVEWIQRLFLAAVGIQVADAHIMADKCGKLLSAAPDTSGHPTSGPRPEMDDMLNVLETFIGPQGVGASPFTESDLAAAIRMEPKIWISPQVEGQTLKAILWNTPAESATALLFVSAKERHPQLGSGVLIRMSIPINVEGDNAAVLAHELNRTETAEWTRCHLLGTWCPDNNPEMGLTFVTFLPAAIYQKGLLDAMCMNMGARGLWAVKRLGDVSTRANLLKEQLQLQP